MKKSSMPPFYKIHGLAIFLLLPLMIACNPQHPENIKWPEITQTMKPWVRWWWQGSAVNKQDLKANLEAYQKANLGGMEITPIYGVYGYEDQFIDYLSPAWVDMLTYTIQQADSLGLGIDMANGTGWPFGGVDRGGRCLQGCRFQNLSG